MSALSEQVRTAIYLGLSRTNLPVYFEEADAEAVYPYLLFRRQASKYEYAFNVTRVCEDDLWLIKAVCDEDAAQAQSKSPTEVNEAALADAMTRFDDLPLSTGQTLAAYPVNDLILPKEILGDRTIFSSGILFRVVANG